MFKHNKEFIEGKVSYMQEINVFGDLSLKDLYSHGQLGLEVPKIVKRIMNMINYSKGLWVGKSKQLPKFVDWRSHSTYKYNTSVKVQGKCGSCWAWASVGTVEFAVMKKNKDLKVEELSVQNLVDCTKVSPYDNKGCKGGWVTDGELNKNKILFLFI